ncbi:ABC transporter ATP-binding protein [Nitrosomonas communis]|uniref:Lipopolysaccharide transport system ATP-binding protein n=1 Tax=Nitrosomonas communis TaxID=44574 RepID=A0A1I4J5R5_9PROT|nr:ABC transporter ATP-binding protein [Nitrosomonas communis]SFL61890.1 lipopolysaccharide transport system ATP-binding protein [Nitrosomonas communis]
MSSEIAIKVENLSKCYHIYATPRDRLKQFIFPRLRRFVGEAGQQYFKEFWALKDVSFEIKKGESMGILGRNGSGKSTLLQIIAGTLTPTAGTVETFGRISALLELGSGFNPEFSGKDNIYLSIALQGFGSDQIDKKYEDIAAFADIGEFIEQPVKIYSSGMYARLAFSAAIHVEPDVLIVDEILAVGDVPFQQKCIKKLYQMMDDGVSILLVSHDAYQIRSICRKALLLQEGRLRMFESSEKVMDEYIAYCSAAGSKARAEKAESSDPAPHPSNIGGNAASSGFAIVIKNPTLIAGNVRHATEINSCDPVCIEFDYEIHGTYSDTISFVVNLYREDNTYVFGTTTRMQGLAEFSPESEAHVSVYFPSLPLVSGKYKWRVAVNDGRGMSILAEAVPVCHFSVNDDFRAVGIVDIPHTWSREVISYANVSRTQRAGSTITKTSERLPGQSIL